MVVAIKEMYIEKIIQDNMEEQLGREVGKAPFTDKDVERTYEKIELVNYRIPKQFSSEVRDLIRSLLKSNPEKSLLLDRVKTHTCKIIVEQPVPTATSSRKQELLDQLAPLQALLDKSVQVMKTG
ncbi:unnamed protein product [Rhizophagus irregularis]|nr:unnamed protein product [Rhizophagus irregularis]